jgi:hypothetical protein
MRFVPNPKMLLENHSTGYWIQVVLQTLRSYIEGLLINKFLPEIWILKFVKPIGSGVPPVVENGESRELVRTDVLEPAEVSTKAPATPFCACANSGMTNTERIFGIPLLTSKLKVCPAPTPSN